MKVRRKTRNLDENSKNKFKRVESVPKKESKNNDNCCSVLQDNDMDMIENINACGLNDAIGKK